MMKKILFVCHGNICRSPMAKYVMRELVANAGLSDEIFVESAAATYEEIGNPVYPPARKKLEEHGISCEGHHARIIVRKEYGDWDYIIGMDQENMDDMRRIFGGDPDGKLCMLMTFVGKNREVSDPWYTGDFESTWQDVLAGCTALLDRIKSEL